MDAALRRLLGNALGAGRLQTLSSAENGAHPSPYASTPKTLSFWHLVGLTFFAVCGGDYGIEDAVGAAGPMYT